jgi:hypothetical protein
MARRAQRLPSIRERFGEFDRTNLAIALAGFMLLLAIAFPRIYPAARHGPQCTDLAAPIGGNNRSLLAQAGGDQQNLDLELAVEQDTISPGGALRVRVTFVNNDIGPVILYLPRDAAPAVLTPDQLKGAGITFELTQVGLAYTRNDQFLQPTASYVNPDDLHLLGSRARCSQEYTLSAVQLGNVGVSAEGEYRIRAFYRYNNIGGQRPVVEGLPTVTATAAYTDQGIWTGEARSDEILFRIQTAAPQ